MSDAMDLYAYETGEFAEKNKETLAALAQIKESINPSYLDWLKLHDDGAIDLDITVLRLAQIWSQLGCENYQPYQYGPTPFRIQNIVGTLFQYELTVDVNMVRKSLAAQLKAGLLKRDGVHYVATRPTVHE